MENDLRQMVASGPSAAVDSVEVMFPDISQVLGLTQLLVTGLLKS